MPNWREYITLGVRVMTFALALGVLGAFWLPWVLIDGIRDASSGTDLLAVVASPSLLKYLYSASPLSAGFLIGCPIGIMVFGIVVAAKYVQRRTAIFATLAVLVFSVALPYGASGLLANGDPSFRFGLAWIMASAAVLVVQQALIKVSTKLRTRRKLPSMYRALAIATGSGFYRWRETE